MGQTSRSDFIETWLTEMPSGLGSFDTYNMLEYSIKEKIKLGFPVVDLGNSLNKIEGDIMVYYWYGDNTNIILGTEIEKKYQGYVVAITGKNPSYKNKPPYASDLYNGILKDTNYSIRLMSDSYLSDEGYGIWKRLFNLGHKVSVYDKQNPGQTFKTFDNSDEMDKFFANDDINYERYQYVLSEGGIKLGEMRGFFHIRRHRELSGIPVDDYPPTSMVLESGARIQQYLERENKCQSY